MFKVGEAYYVKRGINKLYKAHIVAIVDEEYIVFKWYGKYKQWWHYEIMHKEVLKSEIEIANRFYNKFNKTKNEGVTYV